MLATDDVRHHHFYMSDFMFNGDSNFLIGGDRGMQISFGCITMFISIVVMNSTNKDIWIAVHFLHWERKKRKLLKC